MEKPWVHLGRPGSHGWTRVWNDGILESVRVERGRDSRNLCTPSLGRRDDGSGTPVSQCEERVGVHGALGERGPPPVVLRDLDRRPPLTYIDAGLVSPLPGTPPTKPREDLVPASSHPLTSPTHSFPTCPDPVEELGGGPWEGKRDLDRKELPSSLKQGN